jgi:nitroreductase
MPLTNPFLNPFHARYGRSDIPTPDQELNSFTKNLLKRTSCRHFLPNKPLPAGTLELLMAAAQSAPTSGEMQSWSVISLNADDKKKLIDSNTTNQIIGATDGQNIDAITTCQIFLIWIADLHRTNFILQKINTTDQHRMQIKKAEFHLKAVIDASIAAQTLLLTAETMGIEGTYMGAIRQLPMAFLKETYNLPEYTMPLFGMALGYRNTSYDLLQLRRLYDVTRTRPRLPQDLILHHSTYKPMHSLNQLNDYNQVVSRNPSKGINIFEDRVAERMTPRQSKEFMGDSLKQMGFTFE